MSEEKTSKVMADLAHIDTQPTDGSGPGRRIALGVAMRLWCDTHEEQFKRLGLNETYVMNSMFSAFVNGMKENIPENASPEDVAELFRLAAKDTTPVCCRLGQEGLDMIIADAPESSGDRRQDSVDAAYAVPGVTPFNEDEEPDEVKRLVAEWMKKKK